MKKPSEMKWHTSDNHDASKVVQHCYYSNERGPAWNRHLGNSSLCNKKTGLAEDEGVFIPFDKIEEDLIASFCCKKCLYIYDKNLGTNPQIQNYF
jgi:hypothetical protein